jgi:ATP-dependent Clp protease ATP-binding subunit ClpB
VRRRPYSVVLFDEIEKAHQDVFNVLLQILDDGRLTDGHGRTVDFKNTVVIMTSNVGSHLITNYRGREDAAAFEPMKAQVLDALRREFRPEFLNRVDEIVVFHNLSREHLKQIVSIQLKRLQARLDERRITLQLTDKARDYLATTGYDPNYGARPLKRLLQKEIETALGRLILKGDVKDGDAVIVDKSSERAGMNFSTQNKAEEQSAESVAVG